MTFYAAGRMFRTDWFRSQIVVRDGRIVSLEPSNMPARRVRVGRTQRPRTPPRVRPGRNRRSRPRKNQHQTRRKLLRNRSVRPSPLLFDLLESMSSGEIRKTPRGSIFCGQNIENDGVIGMRRTQFFSYSHV